MSAIKEIAGKAGYALIFSVAAPTLLLFWGKALDDCNCFPGVRLPTLGAALIAAGAAAWMLGAAALWTQGGGLPMNAFPPVRFVSGGIYRLVPHPIYTGFTMICGGVAIVKGSGAGLYVVTPLVGLGCAALVWGYEKHDLRRRFGNGASPARLVLPENTSETARGSQRVAAYLLVLLPWLAIYELAGRLGVPKGTASGYFPFEKSWPVVESAEWIYVSVYAGVLLAPLVARTSAELRSFMVEGLLATGAGVLLYLCVPLAVPAKPFEPGGWAGQLLLWERRSDPPPNIAFPSFHAIWALIVAGCIWRRNRAAGIAAAVWATAVSWSCVATGMHALVDIAGAAVVFMAVKARRRVLGGATAIAERIANSRRDWRVGPVRIINHSIYAGVAATVGAGIAGSLAGPACLGGLALAAACSLAGGALWAQFIEGSPRLLRPFGYFGALLGAVLGGIASRLAGANPWVLLAALATAAPIIQAIGRLRCLVQGCCHGRPTQASCGIRYTQPGSRVCKFTAFRDVPLHPTQLYSIAGNIVIAVVLIRLWRQEASAGLITGLYLVLSGMERFVEEAYRGEPQVRHLGRLTEYQWLAVGSVLAGIVLGLLPGGQFPVPAPVAGWSVAAMALGLGLLYAAAMGVDFPNSTRRFARLTG